MRKTSQDGGDSTSITSGIENEIKKSGPGILKSTKNSIKRKVQNLSNESDDTATEPLLHKSKEKSEIEKQSAKFLISKTKTDFASEKGNDKYKLLADEKITRPSISDVTGITDALIANGMTDQNHVTSQSISTASIHNHMNTNVFNSPDGPKNAAASKNIAVISPVPRVATISKLPEKHDITVTSNESVSINASINSMSFGNKGLITDNKDKINAPTQYAAAAHKSNSKATTEDDLRTTNLQSLCIETVVSKSLETPSSAAIDTNKNFQPQPKLDSETIIGDKKVDNKTVLPERISNVSSTKEFSSGSVSNVKGSKSISNSQESKMTTSKINSPIAVNIATTVSTKSSTAIFSGADKVKTVKSTDSSVYKTDSSVLANSIPNTTKPSAIKSPVEEHTANTTKPSTNEALSTNKVNTIKLTEGNASKTVSSLPATLMASTTKSNINKSPDKDHVINIVKTVSSTKPVETFNTNKVNTVKSPESDILKTKTSLSEASSPSTNKSIDQDKGYSVLTSKLTGKETTTQKKLPCGSNTPSNVSNIPATAPTSTKSSVSGSPQVAPSIKTTPIVIKSLPTTNTTKTSTTAPTTNKTTVSAGISTRTGTAYSTLSSTVMTTANDIGTKYNNVATVVSSISKTTTTSSSTKLTSPGSSSTTMTKSPTSVKQSTSPSTVKTISSIPTVKSTIVSTVPHEKKSIKGESNSVTDTMSSVSSTIKKPLTGNDSSPVTITPSAKFVSTSSTKPVAKSPTQSEVKPSKDVKDIKGSKA